MKVALISLYDDYAYAARFLATYLKANGHQVHLLNLKTYVIKMFSYDTNDLEEFYKSSSLRNAFLLSLPLVLFPSYKDD